MARVIAIMVACESSDLGGIARDFVKQWLNGNNNINVKADYVKPLIVEPSETAKAAIKRVRSMNVTEKVLDYIKENKFAVNADLKHIAQNGATYTALNQLIDKGLVVRKGERGSYRYELVNEEEN